MQLFYSIIAMVTEVYPFQHLSFLGIGTESFVFFFFFEV